ncbi:MAG: hypothetical protein LBI84_04960 [Propionibacteriaceae bacterium]|jgi:hypothetical protein|nr:hypothetical protein [Propionibacteriaceae bacterium]
MTLPPPSSYEAPTRAFAFLLPAGWSAVSLADQGERQRQVRALVGRALGRSAGGGPLTELGEELVRSLDAQAAVTAAAGGIVFALALIAGAGTPRPAAMACFDFSAVLRPQPGQDPAAVLAAFTWTGRRPKSTDSLPDPAAPGPGWVRIDGHPHIAYRRDSILPGLEVSEADGPRVGQLEAVYLQLVPGLGAVRTVFSVPLVADRSDWLGLFDALTGLFSVQP